MKGSYILIIEVIKDQEIQIGKLGKLLFKKGFYVYVGSALNNLEKRIQRHLKSDKKIHWHVDYLLKNADILDVYYKKSNVWEECRIAKIFNEEMENIPGFGCSDCKCQSHLFYGSLKLIENMIDFADMKKYWA
jgi:Uri superfamily endonuclease